MSFLLDMLNIDRSVFCLTILVAAAACSGAAKDPFIAECERRLLDELASPSTFKIITLDGKYEAVSFSRYSAFIHETGDDWLSMSDERVLRQLNLKPMYR